MAQRFTELGVFVLKQAGACLFGGALLAVLVAARLWYPDGAALARNDALTLAAVAIQVAMVATRLETLRELRVIVLFHLVGTAMELFKTSAGSWSYEDDGLLRIAEVPLFSGFIRGRRLLHGARAPDLRPAVHRLPAALGHRHPGRRDLRQLLRAPRAAGHALAAARRRGRDLRPVHDALPSAPAELPDADRGGLPAGRPLHLDRRERRDLVQRLAVPEPARGMAPRLPRQARGVVPADDHLGRAGDVGLPAVTGPHVRPGPGR